MKRYMCSILGLLVVILGACGPIQPDPTIGPLLYPLNEQAGYFSENASIQLAKNCFNRDEAIPIQITLQGTYMNIDESLLFIEVIGPLHSPILTHIRWDPPTPTILHPTSAPKTYMWTISLSEPGLYSVALTYEGFKQAAMPSFGVGYIETIDDVSIPCHQLK